MADFSSDIIATQRQWNDILIMLKGKIQPEFYIQKKN